MAPEVLPNETIIPDAIRSADYYLRKARIWADCPHRYYVDGFVRDAREAGNADESEIAAIYELLKRAEKRGYKEAK